MTEMRLNEANNSTNIDFHSIKRHFLQNDSETKMQFVDNQSVLSGFENGTFDLPIDMQFNDGHVLSIVVYAVLMVISAVGNITVLATIIRFRMKARLNRVNLFLLHLAIADLLVTFLMMPLEIGWAATVSWTAGDALCRIMSFFRTFGLYLSGFLLVCISLDRYFAVLKPLTLPEANRRGRYMLYTAWVFSIICSSPQAWIFHVERHPRVEWFEQCVTFGSFTSPQAELAYSLFGFVFMYGFPLGMIIFCYTCILYEIFKINNLTKNGDDLRRSNMGLLGRAKIRTLKMTVVIVATFSLCWTPYNIMCLWYWIDKESALQVDQRVQKALFLFACTNSCFNPMVYGLFHIRTKRTAENPHSQLKNGVQRLEKQSYKVRVRWTPRQCLCAASSDSPNHSSNGHPLRNHPLYEVSGDGPRSLLFLNGVSAHQSLNRPSSRTNSKRYIGSVTQLQLNQMRKANPQIGRLNNNVNGYCYPSLRLEETALLDARLENIVQGQINHTGCKNPTVNNIRGKSKHCGKSKRSGQYGCNSNSYSPPGERDIFSGVKFYSQDAEEGMTSSTFVGSRM